MHFSRTGRGVDRAVRAALDGRDGGLFAVRWCWEGLIFLFPDDACVRWTEGVVVDSIRHGPACVGFSLWQPRDVAT